MLKEESGDLHANGRDRSVRHLDVAVSSLGFLRGTLCGSSRTFTLEFSRGLKRVEGLGSGGGRLAKRRRRSRRSLRRERRRDSRADLGTRRRRPDRTSGRGTTCLSGSWSNRIDWARHGRSQRKVRERQVRLERREERRQGTLAAVVVEVRGPVEGLVELEDDSARGALSFELGVDRKPHKVGDVQDKSDALAHTTKGAAPSHDGVRLAERLENREVSGRRRERRVNGDAPKGPSAPAPNYEPSFESRSGRSSCPQS